MLPERSPAQDAQTNEHTNEGTNQKTNVRTKERTKERASERANKQTHKRTKEQTNDRTSARVQERTKERPNEHANERTNTRANGRRITADDDFLKVKRGRLLRGFGGRLFVPNVSPMPKEGEICCQKQKMRTIVILRMAHNSAEYLSHLARPTKMQYHGFRYRKTKINLL